MLSKAILVFLSLHMVHSLNRSDVHSCIGVLFVCTSLLYWRSAGGDDWRLWEDVRKPVAGQSVCSMVGFDLEIDNSIVCMRFSRERMTEPAELFLMSGGDV